MPAATKNGTASPARIKKPDVTGPTMNAIPKTAPYSEYARSR